VRTLSDAPFTVTVAVLMIVPELLVVGVIPPPLPYLPPPYPLLVWAVPPVEEGVVDPLVELPQAAKMKTSVVNTRKLHQVRVLVCELKRLLCITVSSFASGDTSIENESSNDIYIAGLRGCFSKVGRMTSIETLWLFDFSLHQCYPDLVKIVEMSGGAYSECIHWFLQEPKLRLFCPASTTI